MSALNQQSHLLNDVENDEQHQQFFGHLHWHSSVQSSHFLSHMCWFGF